MAGPALAPAPLARRAALRPSAVVAHPIAQPDAPPASVSVVVPCYNYGAFLPQAVGSVLAQEGVEVEVIVVDDASADDSAAVAEKLVDADSRVRLHRQPRNGGHVAAVNTGISLSAGEFVSRLDADDLLTPGSLARSVALLRRFPTVGLVYGRPRHFVGEPPTDIDTSPVREWTVWSGVDWVADRCRKGYNCITTPEVLLRTSVLERAGGIDARLRIAEDMHWWLRMATLADVGRVDGPDQALHRDHDSSITANIDNMEDLLARRLVFQFYFDGPGGSVAGAAAMDAAWRRALACEALDEACRAYDRGRTGSVDVDAYVDFAREVLPDGFANLSQWRAYQVRARVGARLAPYMPFAATAIARRRIAHVTRFRRWERTGV